MKRTPIALLLAAVVLVAGPAAAARAAGPPHGARPSGVDVSIGQGLVDELLGGHGHHDHGGTPRADDHGLGDGADQGGDGDHGHHDHGGDHHGHHRHDGHHDDDDDDDDDDHDHGLLEELIDDLLDIDLAGPAVLAEPAVVPADHDDDGAAYHLFELLRELIADGALVDFLEDLTGGLVPDGGEEVLDLLDSVTVGVDGVICHVRFLLVRISAAPVPTCAP